MDRGNLQLKDSTNNYAMHFRHDSQTIWNRSHSFMPSMYGCMYEEMRIWMCVKFSMYIHESLQFIFTKTTTNTSTTITPLNGASFQLQNVILHSHCYSAAIDRVILPTVSTLVPVISKILYFRVTLRIRDFHTLESKWQNLLRSPGLSQVF